MSHEVQKKPKKRDIYSLIYSSEQANPAGCSVTMGQVSGTTYEAKRDRYKKFDSSLEAELVGKLEISKGEESDKSSFVQLDPTSAKILSSLPTLAPLAEKSELGSVRCREDVPSYLKDLDSQNINYDPKSRSVISAPSFESAKDSQGANNSQGVNNSKGTTFCWNREPTVRRSMESKHEDAIQQPAQKKIQHSFCYGSHFDLRSRQWGYRCCKQTSRQAPCTSSILNC